MLPGTFAAIDDVNDAIRKKSINRAESPVWKKLKHYKGQTKRSGKGPKTRYYEWDHTHSNIEVYDSRKKHMGVKDPMTGDWVKDAVPGRTLKD